jgi:hypothetical protein
MYVLANLLNNIFSVKFSFETELGRFKHIFKSSAKQRLYYMAGNHDIGFGATGKATAPFIRLWTHLFSHHITVIPKAYDRFQKAYGPLNYIISFGHHIVMVLDTIGLSAPPESPYYNASRTFLQSLPKLCRFNF